MLGARMIAVLFALLILPTAYGQTLERTLLDDSLVNAAERGDTIQVRALLDKGADPNAKDEEGYTALMRAAYKNHVDVVQALLDKGANPNAKRSDGHTALMVAAFNNHIDIVQALLDKGADPNARDKNGDTALRWPAYGGYSAIVKALLSKGADPNVRDKDGSTPLISASSNNHLDVVQALLAKGADPNARDKNGDTALVKAAFAGTTAMVNALLDKGADPNYGVALIFPCSDGNISMVKALLDKGADPNAKEKYGAMPLIEAAERGYADIVEALLDKGADPNTKDGYGKTALMAAVFNNHIDTVQTLLDRGAKRDVKNNDGHTALKLAKLEGLTAVVQLLTHPRRKGSDQKPRESSSVNLFNRLVNAVQRGDTIEVRALLDKGADVNAKDKDGDTFLKLAASEGHTAEIQILLDKGADPNAKNKSGHTALMLAAHEGHIAIVQALLAKGADPNAKSNDGGTALMNASIGGFTTVAQALLANGADVNAKTDIGATALMLAVLKGHTATVQALLDKGADFNVRESEDGNTVLIMATHEGHTAIVEALLAKGADPQVKNNHGLTALMYADRAGFTPIVQLLKKASTADIMRTSTDKQIQAAEKSASTSTPAFGAKSDDVIDFESQKKLEVLENKVRNLMVTRQYREAQLEALGPKHADVLTALDDLAYLYQAKGEYARAEPLLVRALAIRERVLPAAHPDVAGSLNNLALLYQAKGEYARAEPLLVRALAIRERVLPAAHPDVAGSLNSLAVLYLVKGEYAQAEPLLMRALAIYEKESAEHPDVALVLQNLALLYQAQGEYARAEPLLVRALAIRERVLPAGHPDVAAALNNLASLYQEKGEYARAEPLLVRALAIFEKERGAKHPSVGITLHSFASLYEAQGDYGRAVQFLGHSLETSERNLALILATGSENQKQLYLNTLSFETDSSISLHVRSGPANAEAAQLALTTILRRKGRALDAMTDQIASLRRRATPQDQALLDRLSAVRSYLATLQIYGGGKLSPGARREQIAKLEAEFERLEGEISRRSADFRAQSQPVTLEAVRQALPTDAALVEVFVYRPSNPKENISERYGMARYVAYVVAHNDAVPQWVELGETAGIDADIAQWRAALRDPRRNDVKELARKVDERVMRPIRKSLGSTRQIFLSPDGELNLIPFGALVDEKGKYLVENYSITYLTSGRDLLRLQAQGQSRTAPLVLANPLFDLRARNRALVATGRQPNTPDNQNAKNRLSRDFADLNYKRLPGTALEAEALGRLLPDATVLTQEQATEAALKNVSRPRLLHIATHGFFLADLPETATNPRGGFGSAFGRETVELLPATTARFENPLLRSGLVLAGVKQQSSGANEDGVLTALEVAGLDLWGTKLVVLSACETGLGDVRNGEGVYGLRRALVLAGSETQVMSLWKVSDAGTRDLMTAYYTRLQAGEGRTEALRQVQLAMLRGELLPEASGQQIRRRETVETSEASAGKDYRHPYYWAAFIPSGDWRSMSGKEARPQ